MDADLAMGLWTNTVERIISRFVEKTDTCWLWKGKKDYGYGRVGMNGTHYRAHRLIYESVKGPVPNGMVLDHLCRNRACVNPDHLEPVTVRENNIRGVSPIAENAKKTHCQRGHPLSGDNLYEYQFKGNPWRGCKECRRDATRRNRAKNER